VRAAPLASARVDVEAYLARIGYDGPRVPSARTLAALQRAHLRAVPFEALDCHLGNPVTVEPADAYRKVVGDRRGGFCFELNGLFAWLLGELGFAVTLLAGRPVIGADGRLAEPMAHLALLVDCEARWLTDVGFGFTRAMDPLDVDERGEQIRGDRRYRVAPDGDGLVAEQLGTPEPDGYRFDLEPRRREDFAARCAAYASDADSIFVRRAPVVRVHPDGWAHVSRERVTGRRGDRVLDAPIASDAAWRAALREHAGLIVEGTRVRGS